MRMLDVTTAHTHVFPELSAEEKKTRKKEGNKVTFVSGRNNIPTSFLPFLAGLAKKEIKKEREGAKNYFFFCLRYGYNDKREKKKEISGPWIEENFIKTCIRRKLKKHRRYMRCIQ